MKKGVTEMVILIGTMVIMFTSIGASFFVLAPFLSSSSDIVAKNFALTAEAVASAPAIITTSFSLPLKSQIELPEGLQEFNYVINTMYFDPEDPHLVCASQSVIDCDAFTSEGELKGKLLEDTYCYKMYTPLRKTVGRVGDPVHVFRNQTHNLYPLPGDRIYMYRQIPYIKMTGNAGDTVTYVGAYARPDVVESLEC